MAWRERVWMREVCSRLLIRNKVSCLDNLSDAKQLTGLRGREMNNLASQTAEGVRFEFERRRARKTRDLQKMQRARATRE